MPIVSFNNSLVSSLWFCIIFCFGKTSVTDTWYLVCPSIHHLCISKECWVAIRSVCWVPTSGLSLIVSVLIQRPWGAPGNDHGPTVQIKHELFKRKWRWNIYIFSCFVIKNILKKITTYFPKLSIWKLDESP